MELPTLKLPPSQELKTISIPLPTADVPSYKPLVVPPNQLQKPKGTKPIETVDPPKPTLPPPFPPYPLPPADVVVATTIAAVSAVAADYHGTSVSELTAFRQEARESEVHLKVIRNTLSLSPIVIK